MIQSIGPEAAGSILMHFREHDRAVYKNTVASLAAKRHLRPVFVEQKPVPEQVAWMLKLLGARLGEDVAGQLLQLWLIKARETMLAEFLDALGVAHDGKGSVEELPDDIDDAKAAEGVAKLLDTYPAWEVAVYLHTFQGQQPGGWPALTKAIDGEERLAAFRLTEE